MILDLSVVVMGILIAFSVDRWQQSRQEATAEATYLEALSEDLRADTTALGYMIGMHEGRLSAVATVQDLTRGIRPVPEIEGRLAWILNNAGWVTSFESSDATYRDLVSTGQLSLLHDAAFKGDLIRYHERISFYSQFEPLWHSAALEYRPLLRDRLSEGDWQAVTSSNGGTGDSPVNQDAVRRALMGASDIHKVLSTRSSSLRQQRETQISLKLDAAELLSRLQDLMR